MNQRRVLIGLVVAATMALDAAVLVWVDRARDPLLSLLLVLPLLLSQMGLMAAWLALGKTSGPFRLIGVVVVAGLWTGALATIPIPQSSADWAALWVAQTMLVGGPLLLARLLGLRLHQVPADAQSEDSATRAGRWQFSIAYLLGWTTAVAVTLSALRCAGPFGSQSFSIVVQGESPLLLLNSAALTLGALWTALGTRRWVRALVLIGVVGALIVGVPVVLEHDVLPYALFLAEAILLLATLSVFRIAGYRLAWRRED